MEPKNNQIVILDDKNQEHLLEILFTYDNEQRGTSYIFFYEPSNPEEIIVRRVNGDELEEIEDEEEFSEVEEVFNAYEEDPKIQEIK